MPLSDAAVLLLRKEMFASIKLNYGLTSLHHVQLESIIAEVPLAEHCQMLCLQHGEMMVLLLSSNHKAFQMCFNDLEQSGKTEVVNARLMGYSILMVASHMGYVEVVKMLVAAGADPHAAHKKTKLTALMLAARRKYITEDEISTPHVQVYAYLLSLSVDADQLCGNNFSAAQAFSSFKLAAQLTYPGGLGQLVERFSSVAKLRFRHGVTMIPEAGLVDVDQVIQYLAQVEQWRVEPPPLVEESMAAKSATAAALAQINAALAVLPAPARHSFARGAIAAERHAGQPTMYPAVPTQTKGERKHFPQAYKAQVLVQGKGSLPSQTRAFSSPASASAGDEEFDYAPTSATPRTPLPGSRAALSSSNLRSTGTAPASGRPASAGPRSGARYAQSENSSVVSSNAPRSASAPRGRGGQQACRTPSSSGYGTPKAQKGLTSSAKKAVTTTPTTAPGSLSKRLYTLNSAGSARSGGSAVKGSGGSSYDQRSLSSGSGSSGASSGGGGSRMKVQAKVQQQGRTTVQRSTSSSRMKVSPPLKPVRYPDLATHRANRGLSSYPNLTAAAKPKALRQTTTSSETKSPKSPKSPSKQGTRVRLPLATPSLPTEKSPFVTERAKKPQSPGALSGSKSRYQSPSSQRSQTPNSQRFQSPAAQRAVASGRAALLSAAASLTTTARSLRSKANAMAVEDFEEDEPQPTQAQGRGESTRRRL